MKKNDRFIGVCTGYNVDGLGVVKHDGLVFFVKNVLRGEEVEVVVTAMKKTYGFGHCVRHLTVSNHRQEVQCDIYKLCGGCHLQHMDKEEQCYFKRQKVVDCFASIAKMTPNVVEVLDMDSPYRYRNKVQVPIQLVNDEVKMGFYRNHSHDIIEFEDCLVQTKCSNKIVHRMKALLKEYQVASNFRHIVIKHSHNTDEVMVVWVVREYPFKFVEELKEKLMSEFSNIKSIVVNINQRNDNVVLSSDEVILTESGQIKESLNDFYFNISSRSFYQINPIQTKVLYEKAMEYATIKPEDIVVDFYCGTGTIGLFASQYAKKVIGVEIVPEAIADAKVNAENNGINNIQFICADAKDGSKEILKMGQKVDVVFVDPPRKGCDEETLSAIVEMAPKKIVYISCDPSTLARDCKLLKEWGYSVEEVQPVDMFPLTHHVETVCLLTRT